MNVANQLSIKSKTYLLVSLSVAVALILLLVANNGLNILRIEMNDLISSSKIERYTNKLIHQEHEYRLNANGSVYDLKSATEAYEKSLKYIDELNLLFSSIESLELSDDHKLHFNRKTSRQYSQEYKALYLMAVSILTELNRLAGILETEGEYLTLQIQQYVEAKRVDVKNKLSQKTIEKINNGSNIWQYTYVTQLQEKKYRLSPDKAVFASFKHDFKFMMSEWNRLKGLSTQPYEFEKLANFKSSSKKYENAMASWVKLNSQLVTDILPKMKQLGSNVIEKTIESAELAIRHMEEKRNNIAVTLLTVSIITILLGIIFGAIIARSISTVVSSFQNGLLNFFEYLNKQQKVAKPIVVQGNDEIAVMAGVVNENIIKIQNVIDRKHDFQQALMEWSKVDYQDEGATLNKATELSAKALHIARVSIWLFNHDKTELTCENLYCAKSGEHQSGIVLREKDYPEYFKAVLAGGILVVNDARKDARTREFAESYLEPLNIFSMLDLPILQDEQVIGIICHEAVGERKSWQLDEQDFAESIVNAISLSLEIRQRHVAQQELKAQKEILHFQAHHDSLTGLPNRFLFNDRLEQDIKHAKRYGTNIAVLYIDLDHFKAVNDTMGHKVGDELLVEVASRLNNKIRQTDTLARLGGDEFTIVLNDIVNNDVIVEVTQSLLKVMNEPISLSEQSFYVTLSIGIAVAPDDGSSAEELLKNADAAMYHAKEGGRNNYQFYNQDMTEKALERITMETNFRKALHDEEFIVNYQPQMDAESGKFMGTEALIRWNHPELGLIYPDKFLSFAEDTGLIIPMDRWVMKTSMTQYARWYEDGLNPGILALNLSMRQLCKEGCVDAIKQMLDETGCQAQWLELEITEGQIMEDISTSIDILKKIKELGISLAIDDFGTGFSSLSQLKRLPINKLKIDRSFIFGLPDDDEDIVISKSIISLSKNMGLSVIAEGVETQQQKEFLLQNDCSYMQGYYFSKPVTAQEIEGKLKSLI